MPRDGFCHRGHRLSAALHDVVATSSVNVHVHKAGDGSLAGGANFSRSGRQAQPTTRSDGLDDIFANQNAHIVNFG